mmetsp:Transcript_12597/g.50629  ORF Transcript_12597/g.50629 Transcript_12597/m.50629 type:complete len:368 (-) Transcript_12597:25-1128(-)
MGEADDDAGAAAGNNGDEPQRTTKKPRTAVPASASSKPWVEKYRPSTLDDLVAHKDIIGVLKTLIAANRLPHTLLYGPPGTGKTSTITAAAKDMYGASYNAMTLELNASDERGIDVVRNQIKDFAATKRLFATSSKSQKGGSLVKLVILDEADMMTSDAQFALRRVIEKYTANARFCLVCNYANKIIPALQSRCTKFRFAPLEPDQVRGRLDAIVKQEGLRVDPDAVDALLTLSRGDMRRVLNVLQAAAVAYPDRVTYDAIYDVTGNPLPAHVDRIFVSLLNDDVATARATLAEISSTRGYAVADLLERLGDKVLDHDLPDAAKAVLLSKLADVEYRASMATNDKLQLSSVVAAFVHARAAASKLVV